MEKPFLSIVIIFCDKDYQYIPRLLKNIKQDVFVDYELILFDNREKQINQLINFGKDVKVFSKGRNCYQFEGRRFCKDIIKGKYVWFVDADDTVLPVKKDLQEEFFKTKPEIISFLYCSISKDFSPLVVNNSFVIRKNFERFKYMKFKDINEEDLFKYKSLSLWDCWIATDLFKKAMKNIEEDLEIIASEDILINELCCGLIDEICFCKDVVYLYNSPLSHFNNHTVENFKHIIKGYEVYQSIKAREIPHSNFRPKILDCTFFVDFALKTNNPKECIKSLMGLFDKKMLTEIFNKSLKSKTKS